jgi:hypothetical protein
MPTAIPTKPETCGCNLAQAGDISQDQTASERDTAELDCDCDDCDCPICCCPGCC